jgi:hypothetical protein
VKVGRLANVVLPQDLGERDPGLSLFQDADDPTFGEA